MTSTSKDTNRQRRPTTSDLEDANQHRQASRDPSGLVRLPSLANPGVLPWTDGIIFDRSTLITFLLPCLSRNKLGRVLDWPRATNSQHSHIQPHTNTNSLTFLPSSTRATFTFSRQPWSLSRSGTPIKTIKTKSAQPRTLSLENQSLLKTSDEAPTRSFWLLAYGSPGPPRSHQLQTHLRRRIHFIHSTSLLIWSKSDYQRDHQLQHCHAGTRTNIK
jgi:hypothetical protein